MHGIMQNDFMFSGHSERPWHGLGSVVPGCLTSEDALKEAKLDWRVIPAPIYTGGAVTSAQMLGSASVPTPIPGFMANVREDTNEVLGVVSDKYKIIQNVDAFQFADDLMDIKQGEAMYETAGSLFSGRRVFMLINLPKEMILDDEVEKFLCLSNSHDGSGSMKVFITGVRVVCNNTLNAALSGYKRGISIRHMSSADIRRSEALKTFKVADDYFSGIRKFAEKMSTKKVDVDSLLAKLFPEDSSMTQRQKVNNSEVKETVKQLCQRKDDLGNYFGSGWSFVNGVADWRSNAKPRRVTSKSADWKMASFIDGDEVLQKAVDLVLAA